MRNIKHIRLADGRAFPALHVERWTPDGKRRMYKIQHENGGWYYYDTNDVLNIIPISDETYRKLIMKEVYE